MDPDLTIVLLGKTGGGKSASGNTILGRAALESKLSYKPVTTEIKEETGEMFGKQIKVVDTPGILDTKQKMKTFCQKLLRSSRPCLFLVVIRVGRFTREEQQAVKAARRVLGPQGIKKSYLLFTGGDILKNMRLIEFIFDQGDDSLPGVVMKFGGAYHLFNNESGDQDQVRNLLLKAGHLRTDVPDVPVVPAGLQKERRIILLGRPGEGKSSSGNTILGSERFRSACDFYSGSTECESESAEIEGHQVTVVDTPGLTDKEVLTTKQLYEGIRKSIVKVNPGPHAFVIVVRLGRVSEADSRLGRVSEADIKLFKILPKLFGSADASKYSMVLFTHGDELRGRSMDQVIKSNRHVSELVSMCGGRYCVFDNNQSGNRQQVRRFLSTVDQMVSQNGGEHYTSYLFRMAETFIREERSLARAWERFREFFELWFNTEFRGSSQGDSDTEPLIP